jgi:hypothetical protein
VSPCSPPGWPTGCAWSGVAAGSTFAFVRDEVDELVAVDQPATGSQFRSRDAFPALLPQLHSGDLAAAGRRLDPGDLPPVPEQVVAYVDGYGNLKTTWQEPPAEPGTPVRVRVGETELLARSAAAPSRCRQATCRSRRAVRDGRRGPGPTCAGASCCCAAAALPNASGPRSQARPSP